MNRLEEGNNYKLQAMQDKLHEYKMNFSDTYSSVVALKKETKNIASKLEQPVQVKAFESKVAEPRGLRLRGIPERSGIPPDKAFKKDMEKVESVFEFLAGKKCNVKSLKRVGQFKDLSPKPRTLIVQVDDEACRTLLLKASRELKNYRELSGPVFLPKELTIEELKTENETPRMGKVKIDQGVPREKLRIRNLKHEMQNDQGIWEDVYHNVADSAEAPSAWLPNRNHETQVHLLMWNVRSMLDLNRRTALSNALSLQQFNIISLCETWLVDAILNSGLVLGNLSKLRRDRQPKRTGKSSHGGVLIAVDSSIPCEEITEFNVFEDVVGIICHFCSVHLLDLSVYCPRENSPYRWASSKITLLLQEIDKVQQQYYIT